MYKDLVYYTCHYNNKHARAHKSNTRIVLCALVISHSLAHTHTSNMCIIIIPNVLAGAGLGCGAESEGDC